MMKKITPKRATLGRRELRMLITMVKSTAADEIDCNQCQSKMEVFAEEQLEGLSPNRAMRAVEDHLERCMDCREEFLLLLGAIKQLSR